MTMTETETETTEAILAAMLTENTGRHMLDSGGAYGRNWERNGGKTAEDFLAAPEVLVEVWERNGAPVIEYVTLDVFHFLAERLDYAPELDAAMRDFGTAPEREREPWWSCLEEWLEDMGATGPDRGDKPMVVNTYNGEDCLSQVLQYVMFSIPEDDGEIYCALTIHGGCDVRGGYTAPRIFSAYGEGYALFDNADFSICLREPDSVVPDPTVEPPLPMAGVPERHPRTVSIDIRGGYPERYTDDEVSDDIDFTFGETPVEAVGDGDYLITDGPAKGWLASFHPPMV